MFKTVALHALIFFSLAAVDFSPCFVLNKG